MGEDKQMIMNALLKCLQLTYNAGLGNSNPLVKLIYFRNGNDEYVRPVFRDGAGSDGYYDVCVSMDSGTSMIVDVANQFIRKMW